MTARPCSGGSNISAPPRSIATAGSSGGTPSTWASRRSTLDDTLAFVRGFMLFSMLANLAEDRRGVAAEPGADLASALERLEAQGVGKDAALALLEHALVAPVLTAHPTEVRRKSIIDHRNRVAELMRLRDNGVQETSDGELVDEAIRRQISLLWQTRTLRRERLYVADEVDTAISFLRDVFMPVIPDAARAMGTRLRRAHAKLSETRKLDRRRPRRQSERERGLAAPRPRPRIRGRRRRLSRAAPSARRGPVDFVRAGAGRAGSGGARRRERRPEQGANRRALSASDQRHVRAVGGDLSETDRPAAAAPRRVAAARPMPRRKNLART